jgi:hypothetical protein
MSFTTDGGNFFTLLPLASVVVSKSIMNLLAKIEHEKTTEIFAELSNICSLAQNRGVRYTTWILNVNILIDSLEFIRFYIYFRNFHGYVAAGNYPQEEAGA